MSSPPSSGPESVDSESVLDQLGRITSSGTFRPAHRPKRVLKFLVTETLAGRKDDLKDAVIAEKFYKRNEPAMRADAGRLRQKLEDYYRSEGKLDPVRIEIPTGGYVPRFSWFQPRTSGHPDVGGRVQDGENIGTTLRLWVAFAVLLILALSISLYWTFVGRQPKSHKTRVLLANFSSKRQTDEYRVTQILFTSLDHLLRERPDIEVLGPVGHIPWEPNKPGGQPSGYALAQQEGRNNNAAVVVWGDYNTSETSAILSTHVQNVSRPGDLYYETTARLADLKGYDVQHNLAAHTQRLVLVALGLVKFDNDDLTSAVSFFQQALKGLDPSRTPNEVYALDFLLGTSYLRLHEMQRAIDRLTNALALRPQSSAALENRGLAFFYARNLDLAEADLRQGLEVATTSFNKASLYSNLGLVARYRGNRAQAERYTRQAVMLQPSLITAWLNLAFSQDSMGRYSQELSTIEQALAVHPGDQSLLTFRGRANRRLGKYQEAEADLTRVIKSSPLFAVPYFQRALMYLSQKRYDDAIADLDRYLARIEHGKPLLRIHEEDSTSLDDITATDMSFSDPMAPLYWARTQAWIGKNDLERAKRDFETALQHADVASLLDYCGEAGARLTNDPMSECNAAVLLRPDRAEVRVRRARCFLDRNDTTSARSDLTYALHLNPRLASVFTELGYLETQERNIDSAVAHFKRALQLDSLSGDSYVGSLILLHYRETVRNLRIVLPFPAPIQTVRRQWNTLREIMEDDPANLRRNNVAVIGAWDSEYVYRTLVSWMEDGNVMSLAPFGPKPHTLGMALFAIERDASLWYTQPKVYHPDYSRGVGQSRWYIVKWRGVPCFAR